MQNSLKHIIEACLRNKREGQRQLYQRYYSFGLNICLRYARNRDEAKEMLNDGFLKVFRKLDRYNPEYPFEPWLRTLMVHAAIDYFNKRKKDRLEVEWEERDNKEPLYTPADQLAYEDILKAVRQLPPMYQMVFNLYELEGLKHHEIAERLQISIGTSKSNLARAKAKLQKLLAGVYFEKSETNS